MLVAILVALGLSATAVEHPHPDHQPAASETVQQATEYPAGLYRYYEEALAAQEQTIICDHIGGRAATHR
jgi:hypothetical protein